MKNAPRRHLPRPRAAPEAVDCLLLAHYGAYRTAQRPHLLDELLYFMLSTRTTTPACPSAG